MVPSESLFITAMERMATITDLATLTALAQAATPFCGCRMVVEVQTYATDSTDDIQSENRTGSNPRLAQCEFHRQCSPDTILGLVGRLQGYEEAHADKQRLVREIDVILNGEEGAAKQASLCDLVGQIQTLVARVRELEEAARKMEQCVEMASKLPSWSFHVAQALIPGRDALFSALTPSEPLQ